MSSSDGGRPPRTRRRYSGISSIEDGVPWAMRRTPILATFSTVRRDARGANASSLARPDAWSPRSASSRSRFLMNVPRQRLHVFQRSRGQDTVSEVEKVPWTAVRARRHFVGRGEHAIERSEEQCRIEVALDAAVEADALPRLIERSAPIGADHVAAGLAHLAENRAGTDA